MRSHLAAVEHRLPSSRRGYCFSATFKAIDHRSAHDEPMKGLRRMTKRSNDPIPSVNKRKIGGDLPSWPEMTAWRSNQSLRRFALSVSNQPIANRHRGLCERRAALYPVSRWVPAGHRPWPDGAAARLDRFRRRGDTGHAFGWSCRTDALPCCGKRCARFETETN